MQDGTRSSIARQAFVVVCSLAGSMVIAVGLQPILHEKAQLLPFTLAVLAASYFGGLIPGLISTFAGYLISDYFFIEPRFAILTDAPGDYALFGIFTAFGVATSLLANAVQKAMAALREANSRMDIAAAAARIGFLEWRIAEGRLIWTPQLSQMLELEPGSSSGTYEEWSSRLHEADRERVDSLIRENLRLRREDFSFEYRFRSRDGSIRHIEARSRLSFGLTGAPARLFAANIDITERKQAEEILGERSKDLARSNEELQRFAYTLAHDLQEPLRGIRLSSEILLRWRRGQMEAKPDEILNSIVAGADRMRRMIRAILDFASAGHESNADAAPVDLAAAAAAAIQQLQNAVDESGARITLGPLPVVYADEAQILRLFQNYIGNAIKYRGENKPEIEISSQPVRDRIVIAIKDNGIGIDPKYHDRIFEAFHRLHRSSKFDGTGIGLATCKRIVESQGGRTWVESEPGKGATFYFTIPNKPVAPAGQ